MSERAGRDRSIDATAIRTRDAGPDSLRSAEYPFTAATHGATDYYHTYLFAIQAAAQRFQPLPYIRPVLLEF